MKSGFVGLMVDLALTELNATDIGLDQTMESQALTIFL